MDKQEFVITNGKQYIKQDLKGKYKLTGNALIADVWKTKEEAKSILYNSIPVNMRFSLYISELKDGCIIGQETVSKKEALKSRECITANKNKTYKLVKYDFDSDADVQNMIRGFEDVKRALNTYASNAVYKELTDKTMTMNFVVEDIKHYHGRKALSSVDGYKLSKLEDKAVVKRISVKNQWEIAKKLNKHCSSIVSQIDDICKTINELRAQEYEPRVLVDLFENDNLDVDIEV